MCEAALSNAGVSLRDLESGYYYDPTTKSLLHSLARIGLVIRLSRNLQKRRGFVNGAIAVIVDVLCGNHVFIVKLGGIGNLVLVHPIDERGETFLPCCHRYASAIRQSWLFPDSGRFQG